MSSENLETGTGTAGGEDQTPHNVLLEEVRLLLTRFQGLDDLVKEQEGEEKQAACRTEFKSAVDEFTSKLTAAREGMDAKDVEVIDEVLNEINGIEKKSVEEVKESVEKVTSLFGRLSNWCQETLLTPFVNFCKVVVDIVCKYTRKAGEYMGFFKKEEEGKQVQEGQEQQEGENLDGVVKDVDGEKNTPESTL